MLALPGCSISAAGGVHPICSRVFGISEFTRKRLKYENEKNLLEEEIIHQVEKKRVLAVGSVAETSECVTECIGR